MAILQVTVPNAVVPELITIATNALTSKNMDISGLSNVQIGQRYIAELLREALLTHREHQARATALTEFNKALKEREVLLQASKETATADALGILG